MRTFLVGLVILPLFFSAAAVAAQEDDFTPAIKLPDPQVRLPTVNFSQITIDQNEETCGAIANGIGVGCYHIPWIGEYVVGVYIFALSATSILAAVVLMMAGFLWLTAGGNVNQIGQAKEYASGAMLGFLLMLGSYTVLRLINPNLVQFKAITVPVVRSIDLEQVDLLNKSHSCDWEIVVNTRGNVDHPDKRDDSFCDRLRKPTAEQAAAVSNKAIIQCHCERLDFAENLNRDQIKHATPKLAQLIDYVNKNRRCHDGSLCGVTVTSISDDNLFTGACQPWIRDDNNFGNRTACQHGKNSNHYGRLINGETTNLQAFSCAVDFRARTLTECNEILEATVGSGVDVRESDTGCELNVAGGSHVHVAIEHCPGRRGN